MKKTLQSLLATLAVAASLNAAAAEGDYTIELVIFDQNAPGAGALPFDRTASEDALQIDQGRGLSPYNGQPLTQLEALPASKLTLGNEAARLRRQGYQVLWHGGWFQNVSTGSNPSVRLVTADARVEGVVRVDRGRFLHLRPDLLLSHQSAVETAIPQYRFQQSRRMRSEKLHYLDHPHFGILAIINPVDS